MKVIIKVATEFDIKTLEVEAGVRYWEDAEVNGVEDVDGNLIPFRVGDYWCPKIDIDKGVVIDWPKGTKADIHYKVCDNGSYFMKDADGNTVASIESDYVPSIMCPQGGGYGDYIIMHIDENGVIAKWRPTIDGFISDED